MKPGYKNWIPKGMLVSLIAGTVLSLALLLVFGIFGIGVGGKLRVVLGVVFGIAFVVCAKCTQWCVHTPSGIRPKRRRNTRPHSRWISSGSRTRVPVTTALPAVQSVPMREISVFPN